MPCSLSPLPQEAGPDTDDRSGNTAPRKEDGLPCIPQDLLEQIMQVLNVPILGNQTLIHPIMNHTLDNATDPTLNPQVTCGCRSTWTPLGHFFAGLAVAGAIMVTFGLCGLCLRLCEIKDRRTLAQRSSDKE